MKIQNHWREMIVLMRVHVKILNRGRIDPGGSYDDQLVRVKGRIVEWNFRATFLTICFRLDRAIENVVSRISFFYRVRMSRYDVSIYESTNYLRKYLIEEESRKTTTSRWVSRFLERAAAVTYGGTKSWLRYPVKNVTPSPSSFPCGKTPHPHSSRGPYVSSVVA